MPNMSYDDRGKGGQAMSVKRKKKKAKRRAPPRPRDPFWRLRRILGVKRVGNPKAYDRGDERQAERKALSADDE